MHGRIEVREDVVMQNFEEEDAIKWSFQGRKEPVIIKKVN